MNVVFKLCSLLALDKLTHIQSTLETGSHQKKASSHRLKSCTRRSLPPRSDLSPIRIFGSKVSALVPDAKRSKLESKCLKSFLVEYDECTKEWSSSQKVKVPSVAPPGKEATPTLPSKSGDFKIPNDYLSFLRLQ
jgi:hypothetical protein